MTKDEVWYCENSKGHKIPPYQSNYPVPKPTKRRTKIFKILIFMLISICIMMFLSSCGTFRMTEKERQVNYELERLYLDYSYKRDSIIIEYNK